MRLLNRWVLLGLLAGWALSHAAVFGDPPVAVAKRQPTAAEKIRTGLDQKITLQFNATSLNDAIDRLRTKTDLPISIDQPALLNAGINPGDETAQLQIKAADEKAGQVLRKIVNAFRLAYILFEDTVLVTTEEMAAQRQLRQQVTVDLDDVPFEKAARDLARTYGINVVIDKRVRKEAAAPVSLQLENAGLETTMRLMAELVDLKSVRMGNVLFVTTEARAEKIRREEPTPLDPGVPVSPGPIPLNGIGAAPQGRAAPNGNDPPPPGELPPLRPEK